MKIILPLTVILLSSLSAWGQPRNWESEWSRMMTEARREGKVVVMGSADPEVRRELPPAFKKRFGIPLEYIGARGADLSAKQRMERQAGIYSIDVTFGGIGEIATRYQEKWLEPLKPVLILPEVVDAAKWKKGKLWFVDPEERYILRLYNYITGGIVSINTTEVKSQELKSIKDVLQPKWKGKFSLYDPTSTGTGSQDATRFYMQFGEEFVRKLYIGQKPALSRDKRQLADWLARGSYPLSLGVATEDVIRMAEQGLPVEQLYLPDSPGTLSAGNGLVALMDKAPNPNAARLFVNWIASKEGLEILGRARRKPTTRNDIDESYAPEWEVPRPGVTYFDSYTWEVMIQREKMIKSMKELLR